MAKARSKVLRMFLAKTYVVGNFKPFIDRVSLVHSSQINIRHIMGPFGFMISIVLLSIVHRPSPIVHRLSYLAAKYGEFMKVYTLPSL